MFLKTFVPGKGRSDIYMGISYPSLNVKRVLATSPCRWRGSVAPPRPPPRRPGQRRQSRLVRQRSPSIDAASASAEKEGSKGERKIARMIEGGEYAEAAAATRGGLERTIPLPTTEEKKRMPRRAGRKKVVRCYVM